MGRTNGTSAAITNYELSGTLTADTTSTVTITYTEGGVTKTTTFPVTVDEGHTHIWAGDWYVHTPATCTTVGEERRDCTAVTPSHYVERPISIDDIAHAWGAWTTTPPSFIEEREETRICSHDNSHEETRAVDQKHITSATDWSDAFGELNTKTGSYTLYIGGSFSVAGGSGIINTPSGSITVTLKGSGTVSLNSPGSIIRVGANQTIIIDSATLTLQGMTNGVNGATQNNTTAVLYVSGSGARLELRNGTISGNTGVNGGGVFVDYSGSFTITGGTISDNNSTGIGGGVCLGANGANLITMQGGKISGNTAGGNAGGVFVGASATLTMQGGEISGNKANGVVGGGGVFLNASTSRIVKTGGIIYGNDETDTSLKNTATSATNGHAIWWDSSPTRYRNTTLGVSDDISTTDTTTGWGQ